MDIDHDALVEIFTSESEENLREMEEAFVRLESKPDDAETLQAIFRAAHTIKGNAASLGFPALAKFAHTVEDVLDRLRTGSNLLTTPLATVLLQSVDALRQLVGSAVSGTDELLPEHLELLEALTVEASGDLDGPAPHRDDAGERPEAESDRRQGTGRRAGDAEGVASRSHTLRVEIDKLDRMLNLTGEIAVARGRMTDLLDNREGAVQLEAIAEAHRAADRLLLDLQEEVMKVRMVPLGPTFRQFFRTVRDVATSQGKYAALELSGEDVDVDMSVSEHLRDPLTHIVRNAIDHGIERPEVRKSAGKDPKGRISISAWHEGGSIVIQVQDDGRGLDRARIIARARKLGYTSDVEKLPDNELYRLILEPGFSTADKVTEISGRGVGMDVVRRNVELLRGSVSIDSVVGTGTTITIRLPLTLAIIRGFAVGVEEETYVIPLDAVIECIEFPRTEEKTFGSRGVINLRGQPLPYMRLRNVFRLGGEQPDRENVLVLRHHDQQVGLVVDRLFGESQTVIKPLGRMLGDLPGMSGSAILGNGRVALILEIDGLIREALRQDVGDAAMVTSFSAISQPIEGTLH